MPCKDAGRIYDVSPSNKVPWNFPELMGEEFNDVVIANSSVCKTPDDDHVEEEEKKEKNRQGLNNKLTLCVVQ